MKTLLICHAGDTLNEAGLPRWLSSFSELAGVVVIQEPPSRMVRRVRREIRRVGVVRFADVLAFRFYYKIVHSRHDREWEARRLRELMRHYGEPPDAVPVLRTPSPNSDEAVEFIRGRGPDIVIARCKTLLSPRVFSIPPHGTFVMHPGICPEYRNAHGCFWALARRDTGRVGATLLRVDEGVDTGAVYGHYTYDFDERAESHIVIQHRSVLDNLDAIRQRLEDIVTGRATPIDTAGRGSATWGQPWLTRYFAWKWNARRRKRGNESDLAALS